MLGKYFIVWTLLFTAVPAGCLPVMTIGAAVGEARAWRHPPRGRHPNAARDALVFGGASVLVSLVFLWVFRQQLRRTRDVHVQCPAGLSAQMYRLVLWIAFVLGVGCGISMTGSIMPG